MTLSKASRLKQMIQSDQLEFLMEAHNGLSARIVEEAGFAGIWASGLAISASMGVRDNNEASWTQVLDVVEFMADASDIPILLDGDTGYGNFNNMRRLVNKLEQRGIAGVCIEDKIFPKTNSFLRSEFQPLADIDEFCGKIKAGKDSQNDSDFVIVARAESLIAGRGIDDALMRAERYHEAGADAILIHSKQSNPEKIFAFLDSWENRCPVVIVPTKYYRTPTKYFVERQVSVAIWANHLIRGSIQRMQEVATKIRQEQNLSCIEDEIAPIQEVFRLQRDNELVEAEKRYFYEAELGYSALILAAARGSESLGELVSDKPKAMIRIGDKAILEHGVGLLRKQGIHDISVVAGYKAESVQTEGVKIIENGNFANTGQMVSLQSAASTLQDNKIIIFGDVLFKRSLLHLLLEDDSDISLVVDNCFPSRQGSDYVKVRRDPCREGLFREVSLTEIRYSLSNEGFDGEWIGMMKVRECGMALIRDFIAEHENSEEFKTMNIAYMLNCFVQQGVKIGVHLISGQWADVDSILDLNAAHAVVA